MYNITEMAFRVHRKSGLILSQEVIMNLHMPAKGEKRLDIEGTMKACSIIAPYDTTFCVDKVLTVPF